MNGFISSGRRSYKTHFHLLCSGVFYSSGRAKKAYFLGSVLPSFPFSTGVSGSISESSLSSLDWFSNALSTESESSEESSLLSSSEESFFLAATAGFLVSYFFLPESSLSSESSELSSESSLSSLSSESLSFSASLAAYSSPKADGSTLYFST